MGPRLGVGGGVGASSEIIYSSPSIRKKSRGLARIRGGDMVVNGGYT